MIDDVKCAVNISQNDEPKYVILNSITELLPTAKINKHGSIKNKDYYEKLVLGLVCDFVAENYIDSRAIIDKLNSQENQNNIECVLMLDEEKVLLQLSCPIEINHKSIVDKIFRIHFDNTCKKGYIGYENNKMYFLFSEDEQDKYEVIQLNK